jgi:hypothetical protein
MKIVEIPGDSISPLTRDGSDLLRQDFSKVIAEDHGRLHKMAVSIGMVNASSDSLKRKVFLGADMEPDRLRVAGPSERTPVIELGLNRGFVVLIGHASDSGRRRGQVDTKCVSDPLAEVLSEATNNLDVELFFHGEIKIL